MPALLAMILLFIPVVAQAEPTAESQSGASTEVKGDVLYWEGDELVVKQMSGREVRLHVNSGTKIEGVAGGRLKTGDKISATVTPEGQALSITLQLPDSGYSAPPRGGP